MKCRHNWVVVAEFLPGIECKLYILILACLTCGKLDKTIVHSDMWGIK